MKNSIKIDENYYFVSQSVSNETLVTVNKSINHIFVVDVSGSMYYDLPLIRTQLKNKLSTIMRDGDTISIVWFSGRNDSGILKEEVEVKSLKTLTDLNEAIDRWLKPVGLTAFLKPLEHVKELISRIRANRPDSLFSMIFLTDGYNNDCTWKDVTTTLKSLENDLSAATFVEYGFYADSKKLTEMASLIGGEKISTSNFDDFEPIFENKMSTSIQGGKKISVDIPSNHLYDFAFSIGENGSILLYSINDGKLLVNENIDNIYYFSSNETPNNNINDTALYAAAYVLSDKLMNDDAEKLFYVLGDYNLHKTLANAYGKQKLNDFKGAIKECIVDISKRTKGEIEKIADDAYCFMNLINDLGSMENCLFYPNSEYFEYKRIGKKKEVRGSKMTDKDKVRLMEANDLNEANEIIKELSEKNVDLKFEYANKEQGYSLSNLVWNNERANLSVQVRYDGYVNLPKNSYNLKKVDTFKYNNYTLVKDGILNITELPILYSDEVQDLLLKNNVSFMVTDKYCAHVNGTTYGKMVIVDLSSVPLINKKMIKSISANELAKMEWELEKLKADNKVYGYYRKSLFPKESESYTTTYGTECANWLKEIGITDYNGFAPKSDFAKASDFYMSVNLITKIKGLSSLPKVEDVIEKINAGKTLKLSEKIMSTAIINFEKQKEGEIYSSLSDELKLKVLEEYLVKKSTEMNKKKRELMQQVAEIKFALILSKKWFVEFKSFDENKLSLKLDDNELEFTFDLIEKQVEI